MSRAEDFIIKKGIMTQYTGSDTVVEIPQGVKRIYIDGGKEVFSAPETIEKVIFPDGLEIIGSGTFRGCTRLRTIEIPNTVRSIGAAFSHSGLTEITIPGSVRKIGEDAFMDCRALEKVTLSEGLVEIDKEAFCGCFKLSSIRVPEGVKIGDDAFRHCPALRRPEMGLGSLDREEAERIGLSEDTDGCVVKDGVLVKYIGDPVNIKIRDGVREIPCFRIVPLVLYNEHSGIATKSCRLPESLEAIYTQGFLPCWDAPCPVSINLPEGFLRQTRELPSDTCMYLNGPWKKLAQTEDYAALYLFQKDESIQWISQKRIEKEPEKAAAYFAARMKEKVTPSQAERAAAFVMEHEAAVSKEVKQALYDAAVRQRAKKAAALLAPAVTPKDGKPEAGKAGKTAGDGADADGVSQRNAVFKKYKGTDKLLSGVKLAGGGDAPADLIKQAIVPYLEQFPGLPKDCEDYKTALFRPRFVKEADEAAAKLDKKTFQEALEKLYGNKRKGYVWMTGKPVRNAGEAAWLLPYARYGSRAQIAALVSDMKKWGSYAMCGIRGRRDIIIGRSALLLSDTQEAVIQLDADGRLSMYASMRGVRAEALRDGSAMDFGLDKTGKKQYDLGGRTITVFLDSSLTLSLFDEDAKKAVKSIPKKGTDAALAAAAAEDFAGMKQNIKKAVKKRKDQLFADFLSGAKKKADAWKADYLENPILNHIARLLVWSQGENTFTLSEEGAVDAAGVPCAISAAPIALAHPMEMGKEKTRAWQRYFTARGLRQPFLQVWEPAIDEAGIRRNRYAAYPMPLYHFLNREKHGITGSFDYRQGVPDFHFADCEAQIQCEKNGGDAADIMLSITSFTFKIYTRKVNHIAAYFDQIAAQESIARDDAAALAGLLEYCTMAQIVKFINTTMERERKNCLALLLDYKNKEFGDYDPMDSFALE